MNANKPEGMVTFLFTDIEGSTLLWEKHPQEMKAALAKHDVLLRETNAAHNGVVFKTVGDAFCVAFASATDALQAAVEAQRALQQEAWGETPIKVRMGLHTGEAESRDDDFFGQPLNRVARLMSAGHGGQVLVSPATYELLHNKLPVGVTLQDMGERQLKDLEQPQHIYQVVTADLPSKFAPLKTIDLLRHNLPVQLTTFIGREKEIAEIEELLVSSRLLTLAGAGGIGKTRLSLQAAAEMLDEFSDGVWFVELASINDPSLVLKTVLNTLNLQEVAERPALKVLTEFLQAKRSLIILDNCEHLVAACAQLADQLLRSSPNLTILASSREALGIAGEVVYEMPSLSLPDPDKDLALEELAQYEAISLFITRATAVMPGFALTPNNSAALIQICRRLDGIPLAIELAAARVNMLKIEQIAERLDNAFALLTGGSRTALPRQQTLRALIDWSYNLLSEPEKILLNRLAVFVGGWTLESAEAVCAGAGIERAEVFDLLSQLAGKSLVRIEREQGEEARYSLLETIRQYAGDRLVESGEGGKVRERTLTYFLQLAETAESFLHSGEQFLWFKRLQSEHDNFLAALEMCLENGERAEKGLRLAGNLSWFWVARSYLQQGASWLERLLALYSPGTAAVTRAKALSWAGLLNGLQGNLDTARAQLNEAVATYEETDDLRGTAISGIALGLIAYFQRSETTPARSYLEKSLALSRQEGYQWEIGESLHVLGHIATIEGSQREAHAYFEESVQILRKLGDVFSLSHPLNDLGRAARQLGDDEAARALFEESLAISKGIGASYGMAVTLADLGKIALAQRDFESAAGYLRESLLLGEDIGDKMRIIECLTYLAFVMEARGDAKKSARLYGAVESLREVFGILPSNIEFADISRFLEAAWVDIDRAKLAEWRQAGSGLTIEQAVEMALGEDVYMP